MKFKLALTISILSILSINAQSFKEKVSTVEYNGNKSYPPNLIAEFDYQNSTFKVQGSESGGVFYLKKIYSNNNGSYTTYTSNATDPNGNKCHVGVFVYSNSISIGIVYPSGENVQYWIFDLKSDSERKPIQQNGSSNLSKEKMDYLDKYGIIEYRKKYGY